MEEFSRGVGGAIQGEKEDAKIVLDAIADSELWIWGCNFGKPGSLNDINIRDTSPLVTDILLGRMLPEYAFEINNKTISSFIFLSMASILIGASSCQQSQKPLPKKENSFLLFKKRFGRTLNERSVYLCPVGHCWESR